ncbi:MAG TPA: hypothetical protein VM324_11600 [Egibacteraceae bacterium]|nr:hypothetical protein [Egibacteraceae bacterium]
MRPLQDLPVSVDLRGALAEEVTAYVEGEAGWQVVADGGPPRPVLTLTSRARPGEPCVVVVAGTPGHDETRAALLAGALDVVGWPADRARLLDAPLRTSELRPTGRRARILRVGGASGGSGTSTVALALAGLLAWSGRRVVVVGEDDLLRLAGLAPWGGPGAADVAVLHPDEAGEEVAVLARPVPGVPGLAALGGPGAAVADAAGWPAEAVVVDLRAHGRDGADLLVARPDAGLRAAAGARAVVVVGDGPLDGRAVRRVLSAPPVAWLPASARVARAGVAGRIPSALPGRWLAGLRDALVRL